MPQYTCPKISSSVATVTLTLLCCIAASGQYRDFSPVNNDEAFRKKFSTAAAKVTSLTSDFVQVKELTALTEKITSTGKFWYQRSDKVRMEYTKPFQYLIIINGDKMILRDHSKENRINVKSSKLFQQVNRIMINCVQGTILDSRDFKGRVFEDSSRYLIELTPTSKTLGELFKTIVVVLDKTNYSVNSITMNEPSGDITKIDFEHKTLNEPISESTFVR